MAYILYNNDGSVLANIPTGQVDRSTTSLDLIGKNVDNYGQYVNSNLVKLLTNFSAPTINEPRSPKTGQLWYNETLKRLTVYDGVAFKPTYGATVSGTETLTTSTGDLWYDTINSQLKIWNGTIYKLVGPAVSGLFGKFGIDIPTSTVREDDTNIPQKAGIIYSYGSSIGLITTSSFSLKASDGITYLNTGTTSTVVSGLTISKNLDIRENLYINKIRQIPPVHTLVASFNITSYGDPTDATINTAISNIGSGNIAIGQHLRLLYSTTTNISYDQVAYPIGSNAKVVCYYNTTPSVRRFLLIDDPIHPGVTIWKSYDLYYSSALNTFTNIVVL